MPKTFSVESEGHALVVAPLVNISGLAEKDVKPELDHLLQQLEEAAVRNVVVDFAQIAYFGTPMLEAMHRIWRCVRQSDGRMALCNVSNMQREVLHVAGFDTLWPICASRQEAIETLVQ
ncbi:MAG: STAS domain-containing protein [Planctomycetota bacterium]|jgi:anti-anti-sigma factor